MKRTLLFLALLLPALVGFAQKAEKYTENDVKQFYRTLQGDYTAQLNDSVSMALHLTPIWERENDRFHWLYLEAVNKETQEVVEQKVLEIVPVSDVLFKVVCHDLSKPEVFAGKWSNRNYFDGFNTGILRGKRQFTFMKTMDYEYQTNWCGRKSLKCFQPGDRVHFKFAQGDERCYVKRIPSNATNINGYVFIKALTD